jgi:hypothetical protein
MLWYVLGFVLRLFIVCHFHYGKPLVLFLTMCTGRKLAYLEMRIIYALVVWNLEVLPPPEALFDFKAVDKLSHQPQNVYMRFDVPK